MEQSPCEKEIGVTLEVVFSLLTSPCTFSDTEISIAKGQDGRVGKCYAYLLSWPHQNYI